MNIHKKNYFQKRTKPRGPKANERIRSPQVQVISSDGKNLGTLNTGSANQLGIVLNSNPPQSATLKVVLVEY